MDYDGLYLELQTLRTLNAFYGHFRSFAHPKPYVKNDQRDLQPYIFLFLILENLSC
jgi:hypothetical protein